jgi:hypothetical protein
MTKLDSRHLVLAAADRFRFRVFEQRRHLLTMLDARERIDTYTGKTRKRPERSSSVSSPR